MLQSTRKAFTTLELVFVIAIIGILSAVAIPRLAISRDDAVVTKGRTAVATLRTIVGTLRQKRILQGNFTPVDGAAVEAQIQYGLGSDWNRTGNTFVFAGPRGNTCTFEVNASKLVKTSCSVAGMEDL